MIKKLVILTGIVFVIFLTLLILSEKGYDEWQIDSGLKDEVESSNETMVNLGMPVPFAGEVEEMIIGGIKE